MIEKTVLEILTEEEQKAFGRRDLGAFLVATGVAVSLVPWGWVPGVPAAMVGGHLINDAERRFGMIALTRAEERAALSRRVELEQVLGSLRK